MNGIGVMSGSSLDGIDLAYVSFESQDNTQWQLLNTKGIALPIALRSKLSKLTEATAHDIAITNAAYSEFIAEEILSFISEHHIKPDYLAIHGHTIIHLPGHRISWQLLNGGRISAQCGLPVVCDFRNQDMALGGQGTPMAVLADRDLFPGFDYYVNLGGIANVSIAEAHWRAFDLCPCNQVMNYFAHKQGREFDEDGMLARSGFINRPLLEALLNDPYIQKKGPKSIDNSWINSYWIPKILAFEDSDLNYLRTYVEFICRCMETEFFQASAKILLCGGGANNLFMMDVLKEKMSVMQSEIHIPSAEIVNYKEAILIAYAGFLRWQERSNFISDATGAAADTIGGAVYLPPSFKRQL